MAIIDGHTKLAGLLGYPVAHTKSPMIHNTLAESYGDNLVYLPFEVAPADLEEAVKGAFALGVKGLNVTVPHKQAVMEHLVRIDPLAKALGAVNTLVREENGFTGYNTDILGLEAALADAGIEAAGKKVLILGAGGAARAAAFLAQKLQAEKIVIANRSIEKAKDLANSLTAFADQNAASGKTLTKKVTAITLSDLAALANDGKEKDSYLAFQCTSVGLSPHDTECVLSGDTESIFSMIHTGVDLIYKPAETMFMKKLIKDGKTAVNGLNMLLYQGVIAYELWRGTYRQQITTDRDVLERIRKKLTEE